MTVEELIKLLQLCDPESTVIDKNYDDIIDVDDSDVGFVMLAV